MRMERKGEWRERGEWEEGTREGRSSEGIEALFR